MNKDILNLKLRLESITRAAEELRKEKRRRIISNEPPLTSKQETEIKDRFKPKCETTIYEKMAYVMAPLSMSEKEDRFNIPSRILNLNNAPSHIGSVAVSKDIDDKILPDICNHFSYVIYVDLLDLLINKEVSVTWTPDTPPYTRCRALYYQDAFKAKSIFIKKQIDIEYDFPQSKRLDMTIRAIVVSSDFPDYALKNYCAGSYDSLTIPF